MKIVPTYSAEGDTAYVAFGAAREVVQTIAPLADFAIDLDAEGRVVGIEFVTASRLLDPSVFDEDPSLEELIGVTEIAAYIGKRKQNVAQHYTRRDDFPQPVAELPTGRYWRRGDIETWFRGSQIGQRRQRAAEELAAAAGWLTEYLSAGRRSLEDVRRDSELAGLGWASIERAAKAIEIETHRERRRDVWGLPREHPALRERASR